MLQAPFESVSDVGSSVTKDFRIVSAASRDVGKFGMRIMNRTSLRSKDVLTFCACW
jgi:hypothetical protein